MITITIIPDTTPYNIGFNFPDDYLGKEIEIIAFKKRNNFSDNPKSPKNFPSFEIIKIDTNNFKFDRGEANQK